MTKQKILEYFKDINHAYNESTRLDDLSHMLDELMQSNSDEDCISRKAVMDYIKDCTVDLGCVNGTNMVLDVISNMPSIQPTAKENLVVEDSISREFIEIVVNYPPADLCTYPEYKGKPYYSILYRDEDSRNHVGFGTYKIEMLSQWIKEYFMPSIQPKTDEPMQVELEGDGYADGKLVYDYGKCPNCGWDFEYGDKDWEEPYCCHCGQKLHWFESEDKE